jgi:hypothetical protein
LCDAELGEICLLLFQYLSNEFGQLCAFLHQTQPSWLLEQWIFLDQGDLDDVELDLINFTERKELKGGKLFLSCLQGHNPALVQTGKEIEQSLRDKSKSL